MKVDIFGLSRVIGITPELTVISIEKIRIITLGKENSILCSKIEFEWQVPCRCVVIYK